MNNNSSKFLIVGLGNIGIIYKNSRHNIGFLLIDKLIELYSLKSYSNKFGYYSIIEIQEKIFFLLKPNTYMNFSGKAVQYWMIKENIPIKYIFIIVDDLNLNFGVLRIRGKGSDGGHNGLKSIQYYLETSSYARLRFGIGNNFKKNNKKKYVLDSWTKEESYYLKHKIIRAAYASISFGLNGLEKTMNNFNG